MKKGEVVLLVKRTFSELALPCPRIRFLAERPDYEGTTDFGAYELKFYGLPSRSTVLHEIGHVIVSLGQAADAGLEELLDRAAKGWNR